MDDALTIDETLAIPLSEVEWSAIRASGAGGQNVNKVATAIHLRFDFESSPALPPRVKQRLRELDDRRITGDGVIVIKSQAHRTQARNRKAALERLAELIRSALVEEAPRVPTRPPRAAKKKRIEDKRHRGRLKDSRGKVRDG